MYRAVRCQRISVQNVYTISRYIGAQNSFQVCSFCMLTHCKIINPILSNYFRCHSTTIRIQDTFTRRKKKIRQKSKQFAELLEVTDNHTINKKADVLKLNAAHISMLVHSPEIALDQLHKINDRNSEQCKIQDETKINETIDNDTLSSENAMRIVTNCTVNNNDISNIMYEDDDLNLLMRNIKDTEFPSEKFVDNCIPASDITDPKKQPVIKNYIDPKIDKYHSEKYLIQNLLVYLQVYIDCGLINKAYKTLMVHRNRNYNKLSPNLYVSYYDTLLDSYAAKGNLPKVLELLDLMKKDSIKLTPQTYAAAVECLGRQEKNKKITDILHQLLTEMLKSDITLNDIFNKSVFKTNQREIVLKTVKLFDPRFQPTYDSPDLSYECKLLNNINEFKGTNSVGGLLSFNDLRDSLKEQICFERTGEIQVANVKNLNDFNSTYSASREKIEHLEKSWEEAVSDAFDKNLYYLKQQERSPLIKTSALHPFLEVLPKNVYTHAILREIRKLAKISELYSVPLTRFYTDLGQYVFKKYELQKIIADGVLDKTIDVYLKYLQWFVSDKKKLNSRMAWQIFVHEAEKSGPSMKLIPQWPTKVFIGVGKFLYNIILNDIKVDIHVGGKVRQKHYFPAFYTLIRTNDKILTEQIKPHPFVAKLYADTFSETLVFDTGLVPLLIPPRPWTSIHSSGYFITETPFVRLPTSPINATSLYKKTPTKQLYPVFDSINQLSAVPWKVNSRVLDVIIEVFRSGGSEKMNVPQPPSVLPPLAPLDPDTTSAERSKLARERMLHIRRKNEMYSLWCDALYKLSLANYFRDKIFWLPHNIDFRGRVYPVPPHLTHLGSDLARSILLFAQGKPLGPNGLDWLKIHAINLTGILKKDSISKRLRFANENIDLILDSANNPLNGKMWWLDSEEPWQTLAACMEIRDALEAPEPEKYVSNFPIHQDGSCNGLQHYAALGRDEIGAASVNLASSELPGDVYSTVALMVEQQRQIDAENGLEIAKVLEGFIKRKVIKQTVMTTVYGVTKFGARLQILKQLKDLDGFPQEHMWRASLYLVDTTFRSLRTMFKSAREIQDWFIQCARIITMNHGACIEWVTPLGLPVLQPYYKNKFKVESEQYHIDRSQKIDTLKQKNAFPPNFVHSLDSCHMMLTSLFCEREDVTFISVHDCYWTHPCTVEIMNKICREQFVALHSEPILENLSTYFREKYTLEKSKNSETSYNVFTNIPTKGKFDLKQVLSSVYFFS